MRISIQFYLKSDFYKLRVLSLFVVEISKTIPELIIKIVISSNLFCSFNTQFFLIWSAKPFFRYCPATKYYLKADFSGEPIIW